jgi:hypothetical protein
VVWVPCTGGTASWWELLFGVTPSFFLVRTRGHCLPIIDMKHDYNHGVYFPLAPGPCLWTRTHHSAALLLGTAPRPKVGWRLTLLTTGTCLQQCRGCAFTFLGFKPVLK